MRICVTTQGPAEITVTGTILLLGIKDLSHTQLLAEDSLDRRASVIE
jgi:hypothetical protein